ncbi:MAG: hypothetical protein KJ666_18670 [Bacteroidetes bacterium]|nr:hypothetical protein [Bacteroidota bacterium]
MITRKRSLEVVRLHNKTEEIGTTFGVNPKYGMRFPSQHASLLLWMYGMH